MGIRYDHLTGDILVASGIMAYLGAFTKGFRARFVERAEALLAVKGLPSGGGGGTSLVQSMGDLVEIREWAQQGMTWHDAWDMSVYSNNRRI